MASLRDLDVSITEHAQKRMSGRKIGKEKIQLVLTYGRVSHTRNATIHAVGRREIKEHGKFLTDCEGIHVLCSSDDGVIITTYRNHDLRGLRH
jgi:hypothetical protein